MTGLGTGAAPRTPKTPNAAFLSVTVDERRAIESSVDHSSARNFARCEA
jgi:hypothetical protein